MGMNYYHEKNHCRCCGRCERTHIGKQSRGWTFGFHATDTIRSWLDWRSELAKGGRIVDEHGDEVSFPAFIAIVVRSRSQPRSHAREYPSDGFLDAEGHSFTVGEFS